MIVATCYIDNMHPHSLLHTLCIKHFSLINLMGLAGHHRKDMALDTQQPTDYAKIFAEL